MDMFRRIFGGKDNMEPDDKDGLQQAPTDDTQPITDDNSATVEVTNGVDTKEVVPKTPESHDTPEMDDDDPLPIIPNGVTRPLPSEPLPTPLPDVGHLSFGLLTDTGMVRTNNQDAAYSFFTTLESADDRPDFGLFVVADGMGGHHDGEKASAVTVQFVAQEILEQIYIPLLNNRDALNDADRPTITESLISAVKRANEMVLKLVPDGGTTVTAIVIMGNLAHIGHVGDSRAYMITQDGIEQMTRDHSLVQRLIELNQITPEEAEDHHQRNVLYRALGQNEDLEVDTLTRRLPAGASILICSDGLWGLIPDNTIRNTILENSDPQVASEKLIAMANANGGHDNITGIIIKLPG